MAQSFCCNYVHLVFSTKERRNLIVEPTRAWAYIGGISKNLETIPLNVGGTRNHAHMLLAIPPDLCISDVVSKLKANSSRWMKDFRKDFAWQRGYAAFSVSASNKDAVSRYIDQQEEHHRKRSFEDEFLALLKRHKVPYDPRYVFD